MTSCSRCRRAWRGTRAGRPSPPTLLAARVGERLGRVEGEAHDRSSRRSPTAARWRCTRRSFGRGASGSGARRHPPLVVTHRRRPRRGQDDARRRRSAAGYGVTGEVTSPTFALVHEYEAPRSPVLPPRPVPSRAAGASWRNLGWDEILSVRALVLVEWPDRAGDRDAARARADLAAAPAGRSGAPLAVRGMAS